MRQTRREFVRTLFVASQAAVAGRLLSTNLLADSPAPAPTADGLNFLVFGDWGRKGESDQVQVATQMAKAAQDSAAKFVISVGDNFYENGVSSADDEQWRLSFENALPGRVLAGPLARHPWAIMIITGIATHNSPTPRRVHDGTCLEARYYQRNRTPSHRMSRRISFTLIPRRW